MELFSFLSGIVDDEDRTRRANSLARTFFVGLFLLLVAVVVLLAVIALGAASGLEGMVTGGSGTKRIAASGALSAALFAGVGLVRWRRRVRRRRRVRDPLAGPTTGQKNASSSSSSPRRPAT